MYFFIWVHHIYLILKLIFYTINWDISIAIVLCYMILSAKVSNKSQIQVSLIFEEKMIFYMLPHTWVVPRSSVNKHNKKQTGVQKAYKMLAL